MQVEVFPDASVAVQVMVVLPIGYRSVRDLASLRLPVTVAPGQLSVAGGTPLYFAPHWFGSLLRFCSALQVITGFSVSFTITLKEQVDNVFPLASFNLNVMVVVPVGKSEPLAGPVCERTAFPHPAVNTGAV